MSSELHQRDRLAIPLPLRDEKFVLLRHGIFDDPLIDVFVNHDRSFACLAPVAKVDYDHYSPRKLLPGLGQYKKDRGFIVRRLNAIESLFPEDGSVLEIGSSNGAFLDELQQRRPRLKLYSIEPDVGTAAGRSKVSLAGDYRDMKSAVVAGIQADVVCFFHVFEHIADPVEFLATVASLIRPGGKIIIEVPSLDDPLLSMYQSSAYEAFYFQRQHPFVYSGRSLSTVLEQNGWRVTLVQPYQRYGLENHIGWLRSGKPGGDPELSVTLASVEDGYRSALEAAGKTDTVFVTAVRA